MEAKAYCNIHNEYSEIIRFIIKDNDEIEYELKCGHTFWKMW